MKLFYTLTNNIKNYDWGSIDGIPNFMGIENPHGFPMAELWMGAHAATSSFAKTTDGLIPLVALIKSDARAMLGADAAGEFGAKLPYLFKVLSARTPLSLQVHPDKNQAESGFLEENARNIPLYAQERNYKDSNHKPEMILALAPFSLLCGFRDVSETTELFSLIEQNSLQPVIGKLTETGSYTDFYGALNAMTRIEQIAILEATHIRAAQCPGRNSLPAYTASAFAIFERLYSAFPGDIGALAPLYLNFLELAPGEAMYISAGIMHTYLNGMALELMSNSDNVLRAGLTTKHIDIAEVLAVLDPNPYKPEVLLSPDQPGLRTIKTPSREFELSILSPAGEPGVFTATAPTIILGGTEEGIVLEAETEQINLTRGSSIFVPASGAAIRYSGSGTAYLASLPQKEADR